MQIKQLLKQDINREINGVVKVGELDERTLEVELREYVVTREIEKHMLDFFTTFEKNSRLESTNMGVWVSGFFGSGKSHFIKMLSHLLENKDVSHKKAVDYFNEKSISNSLKESIDECSRLDIETILFNIDSKGPMEKDSSAILRTFARVFYEHLGYFGADLKIVEVEKYLVAVGKYDLFKSKIEQNFDSDWEKFRKVLKIKENKFYDAIGETLDISREEAQAWMKEKDDGISIDQFVEDVKSYIETKDSEFRLVFLIDEIGQYIGTDSELMLNLQTIVEDLGANCRGKVWVIVTSQESIDNITKNNINDFSKISARFSTRLPLSSTSVDEVIKKRILEKNENSKPELKGLYTRNETVLRNLYTFDRKATTADVIAYRSEEEFVDSYPFAQYQFRIMQNAFIEIRKSGASGQHMAGGERSMLSGFYEVAQKLQDNEVGVLVPLYRFYDTFNTFLEGSIRRVIDKAEMAAYRNEGLEDYDVNVLKLLFIMRHIDDIRPTIDNLVVSMVDSIYADKVQIKNQLMNSLKRLMRENYVSLYGEDYLFLTDEEQAINKEIKEVVIDSAKITESVYNKIFNDLYPYKRYRYIRYDFDIKQIIDNTTLANSSSRVVLRVLTTASELHGAGDERLAMKSSAGEDKEAIIVLDEKYKYFEELESAEKIRTYARSRNISQLPKPIQDVIQAKLQQASVHDSKAREYIQKAIEESVVFVSGEKLPIQKLSLKEKFDRSLELLVKDVYNKLSYIDENFDREEEIYSLLKRSQESIEGFEKNQEALQDIKSYLEAQKSMHRTVSVADIQRKYQDVPYGFKEIDIAGLLAQMWSKSIITIHHAGKMVLKTDKQIVDLLRKKSFINEVKVTLTVNAPEALLRKVSSFMTEYFNGMPVAFKEEDIRSYLYEKLFQTLEEVKDIEKKYVEYHYPGKKIVASGKTMLSNILNYKDDASAFFTEIDDYSTDLLDWKDDFDEVKQFFNNQYTIFKEGVVKSQRYQKEIGYFDKYPEFNDKLEEIQNIIELERPYNKMSDLQSKLSEIESLYNSVLQNMIYDVTNKLNIVIKEIKEYASDKKNVDHIVSSFEDKVQQLINEAHESKQISMVSGLVNQVYEKQKEVIKTIQFVQTPKPPEPGGEPIIELTVSKTSLLPIATLKNDEEVDEYIEKIRRSLKEKLKNVDSLTIT